VSTVDAVVSLVRAPAAGFDEPFEMLAACHERVERMLVLLERLAEHLKQHGADSPARDAARDVMRYFDTAAPHHHEDEERHVLPALRAQGQGALADRIHADHEVMAVAWARLRQDLHALAEGRVQRDAAHWRDFAALYRAHIALEDDDAYPLAAAAIDAPTRRAIGDEMARRRGVIVAA
jgi:hemerythrin-like domain-containing protein